MNETARSRRIGCLRCGCFGCAAVVALAVLIGALLLVVGLVFEPDRGIERSRSRRELPALPPDRTDPSVAPFEAGRIVLDLSMAQFEIVPGDAGEPIRAEGDYDAGAFELIERFDREGELGWTYRLTFQRRVSWLRLLASDHDNSVRLILPRNTPVTLEGRVGVGESDLELGGLWIVSTELRLGIGDHRISFDDPTPEPMSHFDLDGSIGEVRVSRLGNASPSSTRVSHGIGSMRLGLTGAWRTDGDVELRCGMGECGMRLPREANVVVEDAGMAIGESSVGRLGRRGPARDDWPTLRVRASGRIGSLQLDD